MPLNTWFVEHLSKKYQDLPVRRIPKIESGQPEHALNVLHLLNHSN